ncbi:hypothetical protein SAMN02745166_04288 [Prosthecobacter debontii]|uniref:Uncharacterized protein n=1 Tax=Prosthecobacter debontii TaxID=48467 RepID=A0A1T4YUG3_9BACT|nr:hypothetical protein [Prosthecobacter debontii]SKB05497.1 hypothetical protein SAMN02745166_04288 [Prosthecobacter debontii]
MNILKIVILSFLVMAFSASCTKIDQEPDHDPFQDCFDIPRPSFLVRGEQEIRSNPDYRDFRYNGKFAGCADHFSDLCKLLGLTQAKAEKTYVMHPPDNAADWWDAPNYVEQLREQSKNLGLFYVKGFTDPQNPGRGVIARVYRGNIYLTKVGVSSSKWGVKERHVTDGVSGN